MFIVSNEQKEFAEYSDNAKIETMIVERDTYEIVSLSGDSITISITAPDMRAIFTALIDEDAAVTDTQAEYDRLTAPIIDSLESGRYDTVTNTVTVGIEYTDGVPSLATDEAFADAMYGGILGLFSEMMTEKGRE
jgi:hypothetical protein